MAFQTYADTAAGRTIMLTAEGNPQGIAMFWHYWRERMTVRVTGVPLGEYVTRNFATMTDGTFYTTDLGVTRVDATVFRAREHDVTVAGGTWHQWCPAQTFNHHHKKQ